jgi:gluconate 2-dehydrogenase gamma chain
VREPIVTQTLDDLIDRREALRRAALLLGGALSASTIAGVLAGCEAHRTPDGAWTPRALTSDQLELVATIAEHILPETDTPGARAALVHRFIDAMLADSYTADERQDFVAGLADVDARAQRSSGRAFLRCATPEQRAVLDQLDREAFAATASPPDRLSPLSSSPPDPLSPGSSSPPDPLSPGLSSPPDPLSLRERGNSSRPTSPERRGGQGVRTRGGMPTEPDVPFFRTMKELTLVGYYTSEIGATRELRHAPVPGRFEGCVPLDQIGRAWAV